MIESIMSVVKRNKEFTTYLTILNPQFTICLGNMKPLV